MFFSNKKRIEDDLKILEHSLLNMVTQEQEKDTKEKASRLQDEQERLTFSDFIGLCGAAFYVIMPWVLTFLALMALTGWLLVTWIS